MTTPESITLVESIMNDVRQAQWLRLPSMPSPSQQTLENEVREAKSTSWKVLVVRWKHGEDFHFEAVATAKLKAPVVVRLPPSDAAEAWKISESHLQH